MKYWNQETINKIRQGYYSAVYFNRTKQILLQENKLQTVTMQIFQKNNAFVCGINQVLELLKIGTGYFEKNTWLDKSSELEVQTLSDGDSAEPWEPVMHIKGPYAYFAHLESIYLGILARATNITTNTKKVTAAANNKQVIFFADRFDYFLNQELDGYAAHVGGVNGVATEAQGFIWQKKPLGTIPHALIAAQNGNTVAAAQSFAKNFPDVPLIVLVDFANDCVKTSLEVAKIFNKKLFAVRLDTSEKNIDLSLYKSTHSDKNGVNQHLVKNVRTALDQAGFQHVKIVVSGGFTAEKIASFEKEQVPVDMYGVGSALLQGNIDFTADIVQIEKQNIAKAGREYKINKKLQKRYV